MFVVGLLVVCTLLIGFWCLIPINPDTKKKKTKKKKDLAKFKKQIIKVKGSKPSILK